MISGRHASAEIWNVPGGTRARYAIWTALTLASIGVGLVTTKPHLSLFAWSLVGAALLLGAGIALFANRDSCHLRDARSGHALSNESANLEACASSRTESQGPPLQAIASRLHALQQSIPELLLYIDVNHICRSHNKAVEEALGLSPERIDSQHIATILGTASYDCVKPSIERALAGEEVRLRQVHRNALGQLIAFDARYVPHVGPKGRARGFYAFLSLPFPHIAQPPPAPGDGYAAPSKSQLEQDGGDSVERDAVWERCRARVAAALQGDRFCLFQQSIVRAAVPCETSSHYEILVRFREETGRLIHPGAFLAIAEKAGLTSEIDRWVVERLVRWTRKAHEIPGATLMRFHVNLSKDTVCDETFPTFVRNTLAYQGGTTGVLCFEIAESDLLTHRVQTICCAYALRMLGCQIAIDHFGIASRSLTALIGAPIDFVKIDGSLVHGLLDDAMCRAKAKTIAKVSQSIGVRTIAEHVENDETVEHLRHIGVDFMQGFGIAMPEPLKVLG